MAFLVFLGVGQLSGGGLNDFHRTAIELAAGGDRAVAPKAFSSRSRGSRCRACTQAESPSSMESSTVEAEQSLDMADDLAAGGFGGEHLPKETFEGPAQAKDPVAAVRSLPRSPKAAGRAGGCAGALEAGWGWLGEGIERCGGPARPSGSGRRGRRVYIYLLT